ncbi:ROK family protein [Candidatus Saccharibacteria bacterium]|nr:ROK family protein [Candidatus Saccharibacteria bacterium]
MILVIDIGATKTLIATMDENLDQPQIAEHRHFATPKTPREFLNEFERQYSTMKKEGVKIAVFGIPALVKDGGIIGYFPNLPEWKNETGVAFNPAKELAATVLDGMSVYVLNDADLGAYGEAAGLNFPETLLYIAPGTGVGVGVVTHGLISVHSEAGRMMVEAGGKLVEWEKIASGTAIQRDYGKIANDIKDEATWRMIAARIALGLGALIPAFNPDFVVFGGGVSTNFDKFGSFLPELLAKRMSPLVDIPPILKAREPSWAVVYGGFYYAKFLAGKE